MSENHYKLPHVRNSMKTPFLKVKTGWDAFIIMYLTKESFRIESQLLAQFNKPVGIFYYMLTSDYMHESRRI